MGRRKIDTTWSRSKVKRRSEQIYQDIRSWDHKRNVREVAKNSNIPESVIEQVRHHIFIDKHEIQFLNMMTGERKFFTRQFVADSTIAELWDLASFQKLEGAELAEFKLLVAHEYWERQFMQLGIPYRSRDPGAIRYHGSSYVIEFTKDHWGAHDISPLVDLSRDPWGHIDRVFDGVHPVLGTNFRSHDIFEETIWTRLKQNVLKFFS